MRHLLFWRDCGPRWRLTPLPMKLRALVVDDERPARDELAYLLSTHADLEISEAPSATAALEQMEDNMPDIVFLDIHMPGLDGFHVLQQASALPEPPLFIFVTAYDQYAIRAFEENALDYLLKPVATERLNRSLERARKLLANRQQEEESRRYETLLSRMGQPALPRLAIERSGRICLIPTQQVVLVEADDKRVSALTDDGRHTCHGMPTLGKAEERLAGLPFFRVNRGTLVNLERIHEFSPWFNGKYLLVMNDADHTEVVVSRNRARDFKRQLGV